MAIKAIETRYKGYRFRSRLEARWAVFFDAMNEEYRYETEGYTSPDHSDWAYLPDFYLPRIHLIIEVKGDVTYEDTAKVAPFIDALLALSSPFAFAILRDVVPQPFMLFYDSGHGVTFEDDRVMVSSDIKRWAECPLCRHLAFICACDGCDGSKSTDGYWWISCPACDADNKKRIRVKASKCNPTDTPRLREAYEAARSARFEYGETPKVLRGRQNNK